MKILFVKGLNEKTNEVAISILQEYFNKDEFIIPDVSFKSPLKEAKQIEELSKDCDIIIAYELGGLLALRIKDKNKILINCLFTHNDVYDCKNNELIQYRKIEKIYPAITGDILSELLQLEIDHYNSSSKDIEPIYSLDSNMFIFGQNYKYNNSGKIESMIDCENGSPFILDGNRWGRGAFRYSDTTLGFDVGGNIMEIVGMEERLDYNKYFLFHGLDYYINKIKEREQNNA